MTDSIDSNLFGNTDDLYGNKGHNDEFEPFAQPSPPSSEPLFQVAAPTLEYRSEVVTGTSAENSSDTPADASNRQSWADLMGDSIAYNHNQSYQNYINQGYDQRFAAAAVPVTQALDSYTVPSTVDHQESTQWLVSPEAAAPEQSMAQWNDFPPAQPQDDQPAANPKSAGNEREELYERQFAVLMDLMQHGAWPQAVSKLQAMRAEFPAVQSLEGLLSEALLKTELMDQWTHKIKGRRLTVSQEWLIRRSIPFLFLLTLFVSGAIFYRVFLSPSRQVLAMERANQALVVEATGFVQNGQIDEAISLYNLVLGRDPNNSSAQQGLLIAKQQTGLSVNYDIAIRIANSGNLKRSLLILQSIKAKSPNFRDIDARLSRVNSLLSAQYTYEEAEKEFAQHRWVDAISNYEQTQVLAPDYQSVHVASQISAAYFFGAQKLMIEWPSDDYGTDQIIDFLRKAQGINVQDQTLSASIANLDDIIRGERSLHNNDVNQAIETWRQVYDKKPAILGGYLAEELYRAYLTAAAGMASSDTAKAQELYTSAASLRVRDSNEARIQLQGLGAPLPPIQPMLTPQPTLSLDPSLVGAVAPIPVAAETPTPMTATSQAASPAPSALQGWIAFRTTRDGTVQVYIMRADGSEQKAAPDDVRTRLDAFYQDEHRSPDGRMVTVQNASGRTDTNIFVTNSDGSQTAAIADSTGNESDPVWSHIGDHIAFVSNRTGNDEVWIMRADGSEQTQLTSNTWEWDKHPTWSPDSSQIAFFSNRSGTRQIWVMNSDGKGQRNLSNNSFDDWDPVWLN